MTPLALLACVVGLALGSGAAAAEPGTAAPAERGSAAPAAPLASDGRPVMGTILEIELEAPSDVARPLLDRLFARVAALDATLSSWRPDSALSRLNGRAGAGPQAVDPDLAQVLAQSLAYAELTRGSFDVTVGPVLDLWRRAAERDRVPSAAELAQARSLVGDGVLRAWPPDRAEITRAGSAIGLGAVAKGYAIDLLAAELRRDGIAAALLDFGRSSLWAIGAPPGADGWRLLVRDADGGIAGSVTLRDQAVSASGSLGQWSEIGGRRYGHVIDPRTGQPILRAAQAFVLAPSAALAEALSTALLVLGSEEGLPLVDSLPGCEALVAESGGRVATTPGFRAAVRFEPARPVPGA